ncbi:MAG: CRISPR-associated protein Csx19 [Selenomonadales bacterium]|nr:CRISPR-associated protein Csx19 [Selenomonadales bacterium]
MKISDGLHYDTGFKYLKKYDSLELVDSSDITNILNEYGINKATVVVWMVHGIFWGELSDNKISLLDMENINFKLCQEIRIFNINFELHLRIISNKAVGRLVIDYDKMIDKENIYLSEYVDTVSRFWGENITDDDADKLILHDFSRKLTLKLPVSQLECSNAKFYGLKTRNYIEKDMDTYQVGYGDYRYVEIVPIIGGEK